MCVGRSALQVDDVKTAPMDYRFPTTNQAKHCYTRYNEFHKYVLMLLRVQLLILYLY
jgi:hypothetical protein